MSLHPLSRQSYLNQPDLPSEYGGTSGAVFMQAPVELNSSPVGESGQFIDNLRMAPIIKTDPQTPLQPLHITLDAAGRIQAISAAAVNLGYAIESLIGQSFLQLIPPQEHPTIQALITALVMQKTAMQQCEAELLTASGTSIQCHLTLQSLYRTHTPELLLTYEPIAAPQPHPQQAEAILRQQAEWEKLVRVIAQLVRQSLDLKQILRATVSELQQILNVDRVFIYRSFIDHSGSVLAEALATCCPTVLEQPGLVRLMQERCAQFPVPHSPLTSPRSHRFAGVRQELVIPILEQDTLWGTLVVHQCQTNRSWQDWEVGLLHQLATHLEGIIHQTELYQQVQRLNADLERQIQVRTAQLQLAYDFEATLKRITDKVRDSLKEDQILETAVHELVRTIGINCCNASIYDTENGTATIRYEYTMTVSPYQGRVVCLDAFPEIYGQLLQGQSFQFCSLIHNPVRGRTAALTCPIVDDQGVLGDLWLINQPFYGFNEQDIRLVQQVANQCAIAIRQARLYQAAQTQVEELERLNRLKDDFLSTVSHELRTPMASIKMATQMLEVHLKRLGMLEDSPNQRVAQYFQILQTECQREISLINDLLDLSRLDVERGLQLTALDLPTWVSGIAQPFIEIAHSRQQVLQVHLPFDLPPLLTDSSYLERILTELLHNACKYTPSDEQILVSAQMIDRPEELRLSDRQPRSQSRLQLKVTNTGVEIPTEEQSRIFEKFYRIPTSNPWQHSGTGLGLALVRKLSECLGGTISVDSHAGETCFTIELPLQATESPAGERSPLVH